MTSLSRRRITRVLGLGTAAAVVGALVAVLPVVAQAAPAPDPVAAVDPFIGTGSGGDVVGDVDAFPGAALPFGMVQFSPDTTPDRPSGGGYAYRDSAISGFSLTHLSGVGCPIGGDFPFLPMVGALPGDPSSAAQPFRHDQESASPGAYAVTLDPAGKPIRTEVTAGDRTGAARLTFPATDQARVLVKSAGSQNGSSGATFRVLGDHEIAGSVTSGRFCGQPDSYTVYFDATFDRPITASGTWGGSAPTSSTVYSADPSVTAHGTQSPVGKPLSGKRTSAAQPDQGGGAAAGGYVTFDTRTQPTVGMRVALSYVSADGARANLAAESAPDFDRQRAAAQNRWRAELAKIGVHGGTPAEQRTFYTALYHALLHPSRFDDADGRYLGFDNAVHSVPPGHAQYANFSGWDIYRSQIPLLALLEPDRTGDMVTSLLRDGDEMGWLPKWPVSNGESGVMNGDAADPIIAGAYAFGARNFDAAHALDEMVHGAEGSGAPGQGWYAERPSNAGYLEHGYVPNTQADSISPQPNGASETLEYALADFAVSRLATATGKTEVAQRFLGRSQNWANLFDTATGYVRPRDADGAFPPGDPLAMTSGFGQTGFQEGNTAQYTWEVPQNLAGLIGGLGGNTVAQQRLDDFFTELNAGPNKPKDWQGNEPNIGTPWAYNSAGAPWKAQQTVRRIMSQLYTPTPGGEPGNDDLGAMSSWYVWAAMGIYPQTPGTPVLSVSTPLFDRITVDGGHGRHLLIQAPGAGDANPYLQGLSVNGTPTTHTWLPLPDGPGMTELDFTVGAQPNTQWGTGTADAPPSYPAGPISFPPSTRAFLRTDPGQLRVAAGATSTVNVLVDNTFGTDPATVTWTATPSTPGITATPGTATVTAPGKSATPTQVTIGADPSTQSGFYDVAITGHAADGAPIARAHILVTVAKAGELIPTAYVSNYSDNTVTPVDRRTGNAGPTIPVGSGPDGVTVTPDDSQVFVADNNDNTVTVLSTVDNSVTARIPVGSVAADVAVTPDGRTAWVSNYGDGTVQPIDVATHTAGTPVKVGANAQRLRISPDGKDLWVANQGSGTASEVDLGTRTVVHEIPVGAAPFGIGVGPNGKVYVGNTGGNSVSVLDAASATVSATIALPSTPNGLAVSPDGSTLYVTVGSGGVIPVDLATNTPGALITTGNSPYAVAFAADGATAWVVDSGSNDVRPITVSGARPGSPVTVGNVPDGVGVTHN